MWAELWAAKKSAHKKNVGAKKKKYGRNAVYRWTKSDHMKKVGAQNKKNVGKAHNLQFQIFAPTTLISLICSYSVLRSLH